MRRSSTKQALKKVSIHGGMSDLECELSDDQRHAEHGWIDGLPERCAWKMTTLGSVLSSIDTGKSFRCEERPPQGSEVGVVKVSAVSWGTYDEEESKTCLDASRIEPRYLIQTGDFLFSRANTIQLIGACVIAEAVSRRLMLSDKILRFRFTEQVYPKWVLYWLRSKQGRADIERLSSGNQESMRNIGQERIRAISLPLPEPDEQRRIVAEIEKQFTRLDAGVAALRRVQANLKRYRAAVLKAACEGRLVPTEAELARAEGRPFESGQQLLARILTERRQNWLGRGKYKEPTSLSASGYEPEALPVGWSWATPDELSSSGSYSLGIGPFGSNLKVSDYTAEGTPLIFVRNIRPGRFVKAKEVCVTNAKAEELKAHQALGGDILITKMGAPPGDACLYPADAPKAVITADCIKFRLSTLLPERRFFVHALNSELVKPQILDITKGVAQMKVSLGRFESIGLPLPPLAEQTRIVAEVERRLSVVEELASIVAANLQRGTRMRQAILQKAFTEQRKPIK